MLRVILLGLGLIVLSGCAAIHPAQPHRCLITRKPVLRTPPVAWHLFDVTVLAPLRKGGHSAAASSEPFTESSFWTARDPARLLPEQIRVGPTTSAQRAQGPFTVIRVKEEGKTPGFVVTDTKGDRYLFKLDLVDSPELLTGAEVVASKLLYTLGYAVPSYEILDVPIDDLSAQHELQEILEGRIRQGRVRVSASRWLDGEILGPFSFERYQSCPQLRALKLAYAWVNNTDAKDHNTLMVWAGDKAVGYLIDFGSSLGASASRGPKTPCQGWVYDVDLAESFLELMTLGLHEGGCAPHERPVSPAVGLFSPSVDPRRWKPYVPNLAFDAMTEADGQWMASRLARFSRLQIVAAVAAGAYRDPADAERIVEILEARRQAILKAYLPGSETPSAPAASPPPPERAPFPRVLR